MKLKKELNIIIKSLNSLLKSEMIMINDEIEIQKCPLCNSIPDINPHNLDLAICRKCGILFKFEGDMWNEIDCGEKYKKLQFKKKD